MSARVLSLLSALILSLLAALILSLMPAIGRALWRRSARRHKVMAEAVRAQHCGRAPRGF
jgi:hypothetical protein